MPQRDAAGLGDDQINVHGPGKILPRARPKYKRSRSAVKEEAIIPAIEVKGDVIDLSDEEPIQPYVDLDPMLASDPVFTRAPGPECLHKVPVAWLEYSQVSITNCFRDGQPLEKLYTDIMNGIVDPTEDPNMILTVMRRWQCGKAIYRSINNRRLYVLKQIARDHNPDLCVTVKIKEWDAVL